MRRFTRAIALLCGLTLVATACGIDVALEAPTVAGISTTAPATAAPAPSAEVSPSVTTPQKPRYSKLRVFVASESTEQVWVLEGAPGKDFTLIGKISVGELPHQMAVSPDGRFVVVNNRLSDSASVIDPVAMKEVVRLRTGKQPHGITFSPDSKTLFIAHERDTYIQPFEVGTWKPLPPLIVGLPQHVLTIGAQRPNELLFTVTNSSEADHLRVFDLQTRLITKFKVQDVHDVYYTPDQSEIWSSSSGFLDKPSDRMVIYDPSTRTVREEIHLGPGRYPFHTAKENQDGMYFMPDRSVMVLSDHTGPSLLWLDWKARRIVGETKLGQQPFHNTYDPEGGRLLVTTNVDGMVNVIDVKTRAVIQKVGVPKAHGIASVGLD